MWYGNRHSIHMHTHSCYNIIVRLLSKFVVHTQLACTERNERNRRRRKMLRKNWFAHITIKIWRFAKNLTLLWPFTIYLLSCFIFDYVRVQCEGPFRYKLHFCLFFTQSLFHSLRLTLTLDNDNNCNNFFYFPYREHGQFLKKKNLQWCVSFHSPLGSHWKVRLSLFQAFYFIHSLKFWKFQCNL